MAKAALGRFVLCWCNSPACCGEEQLGLRHPHVPPVGMMLRALCWVGGTHSLSCPCAGYHNVDQAALEQAATPSLREITAQDKPDRATRLDSPVSSTEPAASLEGLSQH